MQSNTNDKHSPKLVYVGENGILYQGDSILLLQHMVSDSVDLVFVDPPFNLGKDYKTDSFDDLIATETYRQWCRLWLLELIRVLRPGGSLFLYHWPRWLMELGTWLDTLPILAYRSWIALKMKGGFPIKGRLHPAHYGILYYTKNGMKPTFNVVRNQTPLCRHCGREIRDYGGYRDKYKKYEIDGVPWVQISDFWEDTRPASQDKTRAVKIVELPLQIPERVILMASNPGDTVLDIFGGGGSTYHAAQLHSRQWVGCEITDVTPILSRIQTFFGLNAKKELPPTLARHFEPSFIERQIKGYATKSHQAVLKSIEPLEKTPKSMHAGKSRVFVSK
jgi:site-specific DNA-methyltransferase (adenine-specific)